MSANVFEKVVDCRPDTVADTVLSRSEPLVLKGLVDEWPAVQAGKRSPQAAADYFRQFYSGDRVTAFFGSPEIQGKVGYNEDLTGFNFERVAATFDEVLDAVFEHFDDSEPPTYYIGSTLLDRWFPGFRDNNDLAFGDVEPLVSVWIGNRSRVSAHFDAADNIACCVTGRRQFTVFPPEQLDNLYIGPWDVTPAGQAISLVDLREPDFDQFPKFRRGARICLRCDAGTRRRTLLAEHVVAPRRGPGWAERAGQLLVAITPRFMGAPLTCSNMRCWSLRDLPPGKGVRGSTSSSTTCSIRRTATGAYTGTQPGNTGAYGRRNCKAAASRPA